MSRTTDRKPEIPCTAGDASETAQVLASTYGLLARVFASEADPGLLDTIRDCGLATWFGAVGDPLDAAVLDDDPGDVCERLAVEYTRLFLGPGPHISPHESVWRRGDGATGLHWGEETAQVKRFVRALGMDYRDDFHHLPDHVSAELELVAGLAAQEKEARGDGRDDDADRFRGIRHRFLREHLGQWARPLAEAITGAERMGFYGAFARLVVTLVESELSTQAAPDSAPAPT